MLDRVRRRSAITPLSCNRVESVKGDRMTSLQIIKMTVLWALTGLAPAWGQGTSQATTQGTTLGTPQGTTQAAAPGSSAGIIEETLRIPMPEAGKAGLEAVM